jgi:hypothetical protein
VSVDVDGHRAAFPGRPPPRVDEVSMDTNRTWPFVVVLSLVCLSVAGPTRAQTAQEKPVVFAMGDDKNVVRVGRQVKDGLQSAVLLTATNLPAGVRDKPLTLVDTNLDGSATTVTLTPGDHMSGEAVDTWIVTVVAKALPANSSERHVAGVEIGGQKYRLTYTLTDRPATAATFTVAPPPSPWILRWDGAPSPLAVTVTTGEQPITGLRIAQSTLREAGGLVQIGTDVFHPLCEKTDCGVPARTTRTFELRLGTLNRQPHGKYTGTVSFAIDQIPELQAVPVTLHATSTRLAVLGGIMLVGGLYLASYVRQLRPMAARAQALRPALALREAIADLRSAATKSVAATPVALTATHARLARLEKDLTTRGLEALGLLPPPQTDAFGLSVDATTKLQTHLTRVATELEALAVLVHQGAEVLGRRWLAATESAHKTHFAGRLEALDAFAAGVVKADDAKAKLAELLAPPPPSGLETPGQAGMMLPEAPPDPVTVEQATFAIERANESAWRIWGFVSFVTGLAVLIVPNAGFGTMLDLFTCFFWGLGITTAGTALQNMTPSSVATGIGISIPKAGQTP